MNQKNLSEFTDEELLQEAKKVRTANITNAFLIGFLVGIVVFSVAQNTWGFLTLIPLFLIYRLVNQKKPDTQKLDFLLKERGLK